MPRMSTDAPEGPVLLNARRFDSSGTPIALSWDETLAEDEEKRLLLSSYSSSNEKLYKATTTSFGIDPAYGCKRLVFDKGPVARLVAAMDKGFALAKMHGKKKGELAVERKDAEGKYLYYDGYSTYGKVEAKLDPQEQRKNTTMLKVGDLPHFCKGIDGFEELYTKAKSVAGDLVLLDMHFLQQSSAQAIFSWHHDCEQYSHMVLSVVLSLTDTKSSMQVAGYDEIMYEGSGSAVAFLSNATHRSGFAERGTKKIAFFFGLPSKMDTYDTYPSVIRAPLPALPVFYDKRSDRQKVSCFCLHNHILVEEKDFAIGMEVYVDGSSGDKLLTAKVKAHPSPDKFILDVLDESGEPSGIEKTVGIDGLNINLPFYKKHVQKKANKHCVKIGKMVECRECYRLCHYACLGLDEQTHTSQITCPICAKKEITVEPKHPHIVTVDGSTIHSTINISMLCFKKSPTTLLLTEKSFMIGIPDIIEGESDNRADTARMGGRRGQRCAIPLKLYSGDPLRVILNLQTTSLKTQQSGLRNGVAFFENVHQFTADQLKAVSRRDPWDYGLPPECLCYQGNGWVHVYLKGLVWSSANAAKNSLGINTNEADLVNFPFKQTVPNAFVPDITGDHIEKMLEAATGKVLSREEEQDVLLCHIVQKWKHDSPGIAPLLDPPIKKEIKKKKKKKKGIKRKMKDEGEGFMVEENGGGGSVKVTESSLGVESSGGSVKGEGSVDGQPSTSDKYKAWNSRHSAKRMNPFDYGFPTTTVVMESKERSGKVRRFVIAEDGTEFTSMKLAYKYFESEVSGSKSMVTSKNEDYMVTEDGGGEIAKVAESPPGVGSSGGSVEGVVSVDGQVSLESGERNIDDAVDGTVPQQERPMSKAKAQAEEFPTGLGGHSVSQDDGDEDDWN